MRHTLLLTLCMVLLLGGLGIGQAAADDAKPIATIAFSGYDNLLTDIEAIGKLSGSPDLAKTLEMQLTMMTEGKGLAGLDKTRPWGVVVLASDIPIPTGYGFIPVTKLEDLVAVLGGKGIPTSDVGDGVWQIGPTDDNPVFVKQKGDWAYICPNPDAFDDVAADPVKLLGDSVSKYNLSVQLLFKNIPEGMRGVALDLIEGGMQAGMGQNPDESDEDYALRAKIAQESIKQVEKVLEELDTILLGIDIDEKTGEIHVDLEQTAIAGSDSAKQMAAIAKGKTAFGGFYQPDAALTGCFFSVISKEQQEQIKNSLDMSRVKLSRTIDEQELYEEESAKAKQLADDIINVFVDSLATGKMDMGFAVSLDWIKTTLIAGSSVADGAAVDKIVRDLAKMAQAEQPQAIKNLKLDAAEHDGIKFHTLTVILPEESEKLIEFVGEELNLVLGIGPKQVYLGIGADALEKLKAAIDNSKAQADTDVAPVRLSLAATPITKFAGDFSENFAIKIVAHSIAAALENSGSDDHITIVGNAIPNGLRYRLTMQKGILKILGMAQSMAQPMDGGM